MNSASRASSASLGVAGVATLRRNFSALGDRRSFAGKVLHRRPAAARVVSRISGIAMVLIGAGLLADRLLS